MLPLRENKKLVERPENEPKMNLNNPIDRKIIFTLLIVAVIVLILAILAIILFLNI